MHQPRILVTGGAGFVGSHACKALAQAGYLPVTYDNLSNGVREAVMWGPLEVGHLEDEARLAAVVAHHRPSAVLHFAALIEAGQSVAAPERFHHNNVAGTRSLLRVMRGAGISRIVYSSSAAVYGEPSMLPIPEAHALRPLNPYGQGKLLVEQMLGEDSAAHGLAYCALRYFNAAGADPEGELRENHDPETHLLPLALQAAATGGAITVFGTDYDTPDGTCIRDYIHVSDLADAHVLALRRLLERGGNLIANLGAGRGYSVLEVLDAVESQLGRAVKVVKGRRRPGDPAALVADASLANRTLGWRPVRSSLAEQILSAARALGISAPVFQAPGPAPGTGGPADKERPVPVGG